MKPKIKALLATHLFVVVAALACHILRVFLLPLKFDTLKVAMENWNEFPLPLFDVWFLKYHPYLCCKVILSHTHENDLQYEDNSLRL